jgi:hypothetical protein
MKKFWGVLLLGLAAAFNLLGASTNQPPTSPEQLQGMIEGCQEAVNNGREQAFDASYETITHKLSELKLNSDAKGDVIRGRELKSGLYYFSIPEEPAGDVSGKDTAFWSPALRQIKPGCS